ncbi:hypothetical protein THAOC_36524 [Thalassiosira oceanica]|uniref:Uncharacterized protein n=2 Tax=Thalassiosira oceanica TaxID=159749 RepID=K0R019_THAOC|nr:hypothetical protein THAOC_36524 [Thalassiosira oceanica]|eukprot:EJK44900.1 hypothetical protein THAOC_36524 [Thalassiosira oceanica]
MADDDHDYTIENADAGASETIPMEAGQIKKGGSGQNYTLSNLPGLLREAAKGIKGITRAHCRPRAICRRIEDDRKGKGIPIAYRVVCFGVWDSLSSSRDAHCVAVQFFLNDYF